MIMEKYILPDLAICFGSPSIRSNMLNRLLYLATKFKLSVETIYNLFSLYKSNFTCGYLWRISNLLIFYIFMDYLVLNYSWALSINSGIIYELSLIEEIAWWTKLVSLMQLISDLHGFPPIFCPFLFLLLYFFYADYILITSLSSSGQPVLSLGIKLGIVHAAYICHRSMVKVLPPPKSHPPFTLVASKGHILYLKWTQGSRSCKQASLRVVSSTNHGYLIKIRFCFSYTWLQSTVQLSTWSSKCLPCKENLESLAIN
jgi:hypothetical protein